MPHNMHSPRPLVLADHHPRRPSQLLEWQTQSRLRPQQAPSRSWLRGGVSGVGVGGVKASEMNEEESGMAEYT